MFAEAVANAQKYAGATSIRVRAGVRLRTLHIEVVDDGVGGAAEGPGLVGLRDRVETAGGKLEVESITGHGTRVAARIPTVDHTRAATAETARPSAGAIR